MNNKDHIDWTSQWATHGWNFHDGFVNLQFTDLGMQPTQAWRKSAIVLAPGPGFGDLSHPTTRLVLRMMSKHIAGRSVLDVGCGSGILSLAAGALGAKDVYGIDIEEDAILHARENAKWNELSDICHFGNINLYKSTNPNQDIVLMNMIRSEQKVAWESIPSQFKQVNQVITSGILLEEKDLYLELTQSWGWHYLEIQEESGWLGFRF